MERFFVPFGSIMNGLAMRGLFVPTSDVSGRLQTTYWNFETMKLAYSQLRAISGNVRKHLEFCRDTIRLIKRLQLLGSAPQPNAQSLSRTMSVRAHGNKLPMKLRNLCFGIQHIH